MEDVKPAKKTLGDLRLGADVLEGSWFSLEVRQSESLNLRVLVRHFLHIAHLPALAPHRAG